MSKELTSINEDKIIIIADTHIGSIYENISYLEEVYNYAIKHSIHHIINAGDIIQSTYRNNDKKYYNEEQQIIHLLDAYPFDQSIINHFLYGNHDYHTVRKKTIYHDMITSRCDFNFLGTKTAYIKVNGEVISIHHHCPSYQIDIPNIAFLISFCGHSHKFAIHKNNKIYVPTLSDDLKFNFPPGFLIATITDSSISLELVTFNPRITEPTLVFKKDISNGILK